LDRAHGKAGGSMASAERPAGQPAKEIFHQVDAYVQRFEKAWQSGGRPAIDDFLPKDGPVRLAVLNELVHVDMERRLRAGDSARPEDARPYLTEARVVAGLDHPNIVPVYDVGNTEDCPFFVVSKFIEGSTLARRIKENRPSVLEATELVARVAETLHYAHTKGLVHRDIKPGNILLEWHGDNHPQVPYVADFGLALRE